MNTSLTVDFIDMHEGVLLGAERDIFNFKNYRQLIYAKTGVKLISIA
jgi:hypothetical protein